MKKKIQVSFAMLILTATSFAQNNFTISGTIIADDAAGEKVYLRLFNEDYKKLTSIDSTTVEGNHFSFAGIAPDQPTFAIVALGGSEKRDLQGFVILEKGDIDLHIGAKSTTKGTVNNEEFNTFIDTLLKQSGYDNPDSYIKTYYDYAKKNSGTPVGDFIVMSSAHLYNTAQLRELLSSTSQQFKKTVTYASLDSRCAKLEASAIGAQYIDVKGKTPEGKDVALSDYVGKSKYVLVDFWASWCGPCRKDMPSIVDAYAKFKPKGLEIVGISLDEKNESWVAAIKQLDITWPQMSDLKGWKSELSAPYGISSIPNTVIVDEDGKIIARGLFGEELLKKLDELLK